MKIGIAQMDCEPGNVDVNLEKIAQFVKKAQETKCRLVLFPEMVDTGYEMSFIKNKASAWDEKPYKCLENLAKEYGIYLAAGISEKK